MKFGLKLMPLRNECECEKHSSFTMRAHRPDKSELIELRFYVPFDTKYVISETSFPASLLNK